MILSIRVLDLEKRDTESETLNFYTNKSVPDKHSTRNIPQETQRAGRNQR